jgi:hypothetical protein
METKQKAVEWLEEQFIWMIEDGVDWFDAFHSVMGKLEQAKQMEKAHIIQFADEYADAVMGGCINRAEQYYNETYGKQHNKKSDQ